MSVSKPRFPPALQRLIGIVLRILVLCATLIPLAVALIQQWLRVKEILASLEWTRLLTGFAWILLALPVMGAISWIILNRLGAHLPYLRLTFIYFISQAAKYLPGGIWAFPGRVAAYQAAGVEPAVSLVSMIREVAALVCGAALVGLAALLAGLPVERWISLAMGVGLSACVVVIFLTQIQSFWRVIAKVKPFQSIANSVLSLDASQFGLRWMPTALFTSLVFWLITGYGFHALMVGINPDAAQLSWFYSAGVFCLAWCAGFVIIVAPAGLGVRESALSVMLSNFMPLSQALSIALVARIWWTAAEAVYILIAAIWLSRRADVGWLSARVKQR